MRGALLIGRKRCVKEKFGREIEVMRMGEIYLGV